MNRATDQIKTRRKFLQMLGSSPLLANPGFLAGSFANLLPAGEVTERKFLGWLDSFQQSDDVISSPDQAFDVMDFEPAARKVLPPAHFGYLATGVDDDGTVRANREGAALVPVGPTARRPFAELMPAAKAEVVRTFLEGAVTAREVQHAEQELPAGGETLTVRLTATPLRAPQATHVLVLVEDITLQKRLERQMLLTGVAHELNNPLATIAGCAEALRERAQDPHLRDLDAFKDFPAYLSLVEEEAYRCKEITGSLLHFVRDPGSRRAPTDLNVLVDKVLELIGHQSRYAQSRLERRPDAELPDVVANEGQLRQVFLGLASNALDAMNGKGTLTVTTRRRNAREVEIGFEDEGPGIPEHVLPRVFDPFFTTKPPGQGTGLGLAIAQGIVADHDGRIEVDTRVGAGTTFRVILPLRPGEAGREKP